jgi:hypothetical protein
MASAGDTTIHPTIIGGSNATEAYPFIASMQSSGGGHFCGGALIRPTWVLTATHCMAGESPTGVQVRIGSTNRTSGGTVAKVSNWTANGTADVTLVKLTAAVSQTPINIAPNANPGPLRLLGWGCTTDPNCGPAPVTLQQLDTSILAQNCGNAAEICVNNPDGWRGACYGDSGGPAVIGTAGNWTLAGSTHGGTSAICGQGPSIYENLPKISAWIDSVAGPGGGNPPPPPSGNLALNKPATGSTSCNANEGPAKAVNGSVTGGNSDKWCSGITGSKSLQVDLGASNTIKKFTIKHAGAGGESTAFNTKNFTVAVSADATTWTTVLTVTNNTASTTDNAVSTTGRYIRLTTTDPVARIYEFEAYSS